MNITCTVIDEESVVCNGQQYDIPEAMLTYKDAWFWIYIGIYTGLVLFAGLVSGLTMGLLSLDYTTLMTMKEGGTVKEKKHAARILPMVKRHHLLLVTLLLSNAAAVEAMPIFLDRVSNPVIAIVISVTAVLVFGEVIPQAICTRYGLAIGAYLAPLVYFLMGIFFVISYPFSKLLDCCLGTEHGTFYRRGQLKALFDIQGEEAADGDHGPHQDTLTHDEVVIMKGCLDMKFKKAKDAMVDIDKVYMLDINTRLDHEKMTQVIHRGHSRIPVFVGERSNIIGFLLTKTLIKLDPDDAIPVANLIHEEQYGRSALFTESDTPLFELLNLFQTGKSHLAVVKQAKCKVDDHLLDIAEEESDPLLVNAEMPSSYHPDPGTLPEGTVIGIITLEDIIEELLQEEIEDETDTNRGITQRLIFSMAKHNKNKTTPSVHRAMSHPQTSAVSRDRSTSEILDF